MRIYPSSEEMIFFQQYIIDFISVQVYTYKIVVLGGNPDGILSKCFPLQRTVTSNLENLQSHVRHALNVFFELKELPMWRAHNKLNSHKLLLLPILAV